jgi:hypothetical protein
VARIIYHSDGSWSVISDELDPQSPRETGGPWFAGYPLGAIFAACLIGGLVLLAVKYWLVTVIVVGIILTLIAALVIPAILRGRKSP